MGRERWINMKSKSSRLRNTLTLLLILISASIVLTSVSINGPWPGIDVGQASPTTTFYVDPASIVPPPVVGPGNTFSVDVKVSEAFYLYSWQVYMSWDPAILETSLADVVFGGFLTDQPESSTTSKRVEAAFLIVGESTFGDYPGKTAAEGLLFTVTFTVLAAGETTIAIDHADFTYYYECFSPPMMDKILDFPKNNGYFSNVEEITHTLTVTSEPISGVGFTVDGTPHSTPWSDLLDEGSYTVIMPSTWGIYDFDEWEDGSTSPSRTISLTADKTITAYYVKRQWT
jgi:hypothetical protein